MSKTRKVKAKPDHPSVVHWAFSGRCNLQCTFCYGPFVKGKMTLSQKKKILKKIVAAGVPQLTVTGGEPLLDSDVFEIIALAAKAGLYISLHTNGLLLNEGAQKKLAGNLSRLSLALDGSSEGLNLTMRGAKGFRASTLRGLKWARSIQLPVTIKTVLTSKNFEDLAGMRKLLEKELAYSDQNLWYISEFLPIRGAAKTDREYRISRGERLRALSQIEGSLLPIHFKSKAQIEKFPYFYIDANGVVFSWSKKKKEDVAVGSLLDDDLKTCWKKIQKLK